VKPLADRSRKQADTALWLQSRACKKIWTSEQQTLSRQDVSKPTVADGLALQQIPSSARRRQEMVSAARLSV
jgi:hypothetical protein